MRTTSSTDTDTSYLSECRLVPRLDDKTRTSLNQIVKHCAKEFDAPLSLVTTMEPARQRFLAAEGTTLEETSLEDSFCRYAVSLEQPLLVKDALEDPRFSSTSLVLNAPFVRSYVGIPIRHPEGPFTGALCLIDTHPNRFSAKTIERLKVFASIVEDVLCLQISNGRVTSLSKELQNKNMRLLRSNRILQKAERLAKIGSWEVDLGSKDFSLSKGALEILEFHSDKKLTPKNLFSVCDNVARREIKQRFQLAQKHSTPFDSEISITVASGTDKRIQISAECICDDKSSRMVGVLKDISEAYQANIALRHMAEHDKLTGLYNRHALESLLINRLSVCATGPCSVGVLLMDLDGFKDVNDTFGHVIGDRVLEEVSDKIRATISDDCMVARWGGDEFALVFPEGLEIGEAKQLAQSLRGALHYKTTLASQPVYISATIGVAFASCGMSVKDILRKADVALYHGKRRERGSVHVYDTRMERENFARCKSLDLVRTALKEGRLFPGYQPIVDLTTGKTIGLEALMRINARSGQMITAGELLPALADPIVSREIGVSMMNQVAKEFSGLQGALTSLRFVSINAAESDLLSRGFVDSLLLNMEANGVDFSDVTLEVTETMLLAENAQDLCAVLQELKRRGVRIALDDFGTGYSSFSHLRQFPIDKVKIDRSFVQAMEHEESALMIVQSLISMARNIGLEVIAEGIETKSQKERLIDMGCKFGQGFLFGAAMDLSSIATRQLEKAC